MKNQESRNQRLCLSGHQRGREYIEEEKINDNNILDDERVYGEMKKHI